MSKSNNQVTHSLKAYFDKGNGVSNYGNNTILIIEHFKDWSIKKLAKEGIALEWVKNLDSGCVLQIKLVEIDTGNTSLRTLMSFLPIIGNFFGPAVIFEVEGQYSDNSKNVPLSYREEDCNAPRGTKLSLTFAAGKAANRLTEDIKHILENK